MEGTHQGCSIVVWEHGAVLQDLGSSLNVGHETKTSCYWNLLPILGGGRLPGPPISPAPVFLPHLLGGVREPDTDSS